MKNYFFKIFLKYKNKQIFSHRSLFLISLSQMKIFFHCIKLKFYLYQFVWYLISFLYIYILQDYV
jgi:type III secretory pathway component EscU